MDVAAWAETAATESAAAAATATRPPVRTVRAVRPVRRTVRAIMIEIPLGHRVVIPYAPSDDLCANTVHPVLSALGNNVKVPKGLQIINTLP
ncbi:hypothetical protein GCM10023100_25790 [Actinocorallia cavernae]|uniref:Uncharacterized protein n=2 Tax=Actinomycetes TaxID=1760 RepID=A0ABN3LUU1_9ACTN